MTALRGPQAAARAAGTPVLAPGLSAVIAVLMAFASLGGLVLHGLYRDNTSLVLAVPSLVVALVVNRKRRPGVPPPPDPAGPRE